MGHRLLPAAFARARRPRVPDPGSRLRRGRGRALLDRYWGYYRHLVARLASLLPIEIPTPTTVSEYPRGTLCTGDPFELAGDEFNFKHPANYLFPLEQGRARGGHYRAVERAELADFLAYRPIPHRAPMWHRLACTASTIATAALPLLAFWAFVRRRRPVRDDRSRV